MDGVDYLFPEPRFLRRIGEMGKLKLVFFVLLGMTAFFIYFWSCTGKFKKLKIFRTGEISDAPGQA